jgi:hypothetical protein
MTYWDNLTTKQGTFRQPERHPPSRARDENPFHEPSRPAIVGGAQLEFKKPSERRRTKGQQNEVQMNNAVGVQR